MNSPEDIKNLAWQRLQEAEVLANNGLYDGAFYLAGYSVELMLKAKICQRLGVPNIFAENDDSHKQISGIADIKKSLKTHNLNVLLIYSGLKIIFDLEKARDRNLFKQNSLLFSNWDENCRYKPCGHMKAQDVLSLIELLKSDSGLLRWIEAN